jgi:hypothetical protein
MGRKSPAILACFSLSVPCGVSATPKRAVRVG